MFTHSDITPSVNELKDVTVSSPSTNDGLVFNEASDEWENIAIAPKNHATPSTDYGVADADNYGHVKVTSDYNPNGTPDPKKVLNQTGAKNLYTALHNADNDLNSAIQQVDNNKAPKNHASTSTTYGVADSSRYGHVKISNYYRSSASSDTALSLSGAKSLYTDLYNEYDELRTDMLRNDFITPGNTICIGDSYAAGVGAEGNNGWPIFLKEKMGYNLSWRSGKFFMSCIGGAGFVNRGEGNKNFLDGISDIRNSMTQQEISETTTIIVAGGFNDRVYVPWGDPGNLAGAVATFLSRCKMWFPKAVVHVFNISGTIHTTIDQRINIEQGYHFGTLFQNGSPSGARTIAGTYHNLSTLVELVGHQCGDGLHLDELGYQYIANLMYACLSMGGPPHVVIPYVDIVIPDLANIYVRGDNYMTTLTMYLGSHFRTTTSASDHSAVDGQYLIERLPYHVTGTFGKEGITDNSTFLRYLSFDWVQMNASGAINYPVGSNVWYPATFHLFLGCDNGRDDEIKVLASCIRPGGTWLEIPVGQRVQYLIYNAQATYPTSML